MSSLWTHLKQLNPLYQDEDVTALQPKTDAELKKIRKLLRQAKAQGVKGAKVCEGTLIHASGQKQPFEVYGNDEELKGNWQTLLGSSDITLCMAKDGTGGFGWDNKVQSIHTLPINKFTFDGKEIDIVRGKVITFSLAKF